MSVATSDSRRLEEDPADARARLLAELREVAHWRRLVAARLDLAVAATIGLEEPPARDLPACPGLPAGLRGLVGLDCEDASLRAEAAGLERLRAVLDDLDAYALTLRALGSGHG